MAEKKKPTAADKAERRAKVIERRVDRIGDAALKGKRPLFGKKDKS
ncbi:hypothetical protein [Streptomyces qinglanensis]